MRRFCAVNKFFGPLDTNAENYNSLKCLKWPKMFKTESHRVERCKMFDSPFSDCNFLFCIDCFVIDLLVLLICW